MGRIESFNLKIEALCCERRVRVHLPACYDMDKNATFSSLYMHDGQNLFHDEEAYQGKSWGMLETLEQLENEGMPLIVVALDHAPKRRGDELAPFELEGMLRKHSKRVHGGNGDKYGAFFANELVSYVDKNYRTKSQREHRLMAGSSLGALSSMYIAFMYPDVFGGVALMSCALWFSKTEMLAFLEKREITPETRFFISVGDSEHEKIAGFDFSKVYVKNAEEIREILLKKGISSGNIVMEVDKGGEHSAVSWGKMLPETIKFII